MSIVTLHGCTLPKTSHDRDELVPPSTACTTEGKLTACISPAVNALNQHWT